jgi:leucyl-tRNA synthetase
VVNSILAEPTELRRMRAEMEPIDETGFISKELFALAKGEFDVDMQVFSESDPAKYDPKNKARTARPFKPAILIE